MLESDMNNKIYILIILFLLCAVKKGGVKKAKNLPKWENQFSS